MKFKIKLDGLDKLEEKINILKKTIKEINEINFEVKIEEDEIQNLSDCAKEIKNQD